MSAPRFIRDHEVAALLDHATLADEIGRAHQSLSNGSAAQPVPYAVHVGELASDTTSAVPMVALDKTSDLVAVKMLIDAPSNRQVGLPAQQSTVAVYSASTARCVAVIEGKALTRIRTACVTAVASRALARPDARILGLVGAGALAVEHVRSHAVLLGVREVVVWSRTRERVEEFRRQADEYASIAVASSIDEVAEAADVICTLVPSSHSLLDGRSLHPGVHLNAVGSPPRPQFAELDPSVFAVADIAVVDRREVAVADSGNVINALAAQTVAHEDLIELGDVLSRRHPGRTGPTQISVFNSVGLGLQDLAAATSILARAATTIG